jgi:hypothetical protein
MIIPLMLAMLIQEPAKDPEAKKKAEAARAEVARALKATAEKGFEFSGRGTEGEDGIGFEGDLEGAVGAPFAARVKGTRDRSVFEVFHAKGKTVERVTRTDRDFDVYDAGDEILSVLDLARLAGFAGKAEQAKEGAEEKLDGVAARVFTIALSKEAVRMHLKYADDPDGDEPETEYSGVDLKVWVGKESGLVLKLEAEVRKSYAADEPDAPEEECASSYTFVLKGHGKAKAEIPEDVRKLLED